MNRWSDAIGKSLGETNFGIVCITRANQHVPWLIFEAGALAKSVKLARVVPLRIGLSPCGSDGPTLGFPGASARPRWSESVGPRHQFRL